ncbi:MAG TPA: ABC transporter ATP-binding protein, partial [Actinomycetota bacterium]
MSETGLRDPAPPKAGEATPHLEAVGLSKDFDTRKGPLRALDHVDFRVQKNELVCLVGSSGCGKSTLLAIVAGLDLPTEGEVLLNGVPVAGPGPDRGLVFQGYSLYPWRTVAENVAFGLELKHLPAADIKARVAHYLDVMGLTGFADSLPAQLSGGMRQRTAIARALATEPQVLLMDEPFGALDTQTRQAMQEFLLTVWREVGTTILMVTHSVEEAVFLSQRLYVMSPRPGRIAAELAVPFGPDRHHALMREAAFQELCLQVDKLLRLVPLRADAA